jgi:hypothetical protein
LEIKHWDKEFFTTEIPEKRMVGRIAAPGETSYEIGLIRV